MIRGVNFLADFDPDSATWGLLGPTHQWTWPRFGSLQIQFTMFRHQFRYKLKTLLEAQQLMEGHATGGACTASATGEWNSVDRVDRFLTRIVLGRPFVKRFALGPMQSDRCLSCLPVLYVTLVYCGQTVGSIKIQLVWR